MAVAEPVGDESAMLVLTRGDAKGELVARVALRGAIAGPATTAYKGHQHVFELTLSEAAVEANDCGLWAGSACYVFDCASVVDANRWANWISAAGGADAEGADGSPKSSSHKKEKEHKDPRKLSVGLLMLGDMNVSFKVAAFGLASTWHMPPSIEGLLQLAWAEPRHGEAALANPAQLRGKFVLMERGGGATYAEKAHRAQDAGAAGLIVTTDTSSLLVPVDTKGVSDGVFIPVLRAPGWPHHYQ